MSRTLISVDLDWLNRAERPLCQLRGILKHIPKKTPAIMTVQHHEFMPQLRRWIKSGKVQTPFNIMNIDEHHDYYVNPPPHDPRGDAINCGVWGYRIPLDWYSRYTWVHNGDGVFHNWDEAEQWFADVGISCSVRDRHRLSELNGRIVAAVFCVSPDYLDYDMWDHIHEAVEIVTDHFSLKKAPLQLKKGSVSEVDGWRMAPRPLKVRK